MDGLHRRWRRVGCLPGRGQGWVGQSKQLTEELVEGDCEGDPCSAGVGNSVTMLFFFQTRATPQTLGELFAAVVTHRRHDFLQDRRPRWMGSRWTVNEAGPVKVLGHILRCSVFFSGEGESSESWVPHSLRRCLCGVAGDASIRGIAAQIASDRQVSTAEKKAFDQRTRKWVMGPRVTRGPLGKWYGGQTPTSAYTRARNEHISASHCHVRCPALQCCQSMPPKWDCSQHCGHAEERPGNVAVRRQPPKGCFHSSCAQVYRGSPSIHQW